MSDLPHLTVVYITARKDPKLEWFTTALKAQGFHGKLVVVDFWADGNDPNRVPPKPTVWQGKHRLTKNDYFAAANARNTGLCLAPDGWIAYIDDLSWIGPRWLEAIQDGMRDNYIVCGAYKKVHKLEIVENVPTYEEFQQGIDSRWHQGRDDGPVPLNGNQMYGCSLAGPIEAFLSINGWDEDADLTGMGGEDYICGMMLEKHGWKFRYDRRMLSLESEEHHHSDCHMKRVILKKAGAADASHAILNLVKKQRATAPNYFGPQGIRSLRQRCLNGSPFPIAQIPQHSWYDGTPLSEL